MISTRIFNNYKAKRLLFVLWIAALFDLVTFFYGGLYQFEVNPIYLLSQSIILVVTLKIVILLALSYVFLKYYPQTSYLLAYALTFVMVYAIIVQFLGGISNLYVAHSVNTSIPGEVVPLERQEALNLNVVVWMLTLYFPLIISLIAFYIFEKIYLE
jgi:membrane-associated HD superfamily phosphohydrolase